MTLRHDWELEEILYLLKLPLSDLIYQAQTVYREYFDPNQVQLSTLLNIKSGACPEDCAYCPQSARYSDERAPLLDLDKVLASAREAQARGATRFCMGAAWRQPGGRDFPRVLEMVKAVKALGMETCVTLGMLDQSQAQALREAGLDYYNHNLDTSENYYPQIISTRTYQDRLDTLGYVRQAGIKVCCGGILGLGENLADRAALLMALANLPSHPESVPINQLVRIEGTPLADAAVLDPFDMVRAIAVARILMPASYVRLSAGRAEMSDELQALCFLAGANAVFYGDTLLTAPNASEDRDRRLFERLGLRAG